MIRHAIALVSIASFAALASCAGALRTGGESAPVARAALVSAEGAARGEATLRRTGEGLTLRIDARGLPAGPHGIHLHTAGLCGAPGFASAGGHLNPAGRQHGLHNPQGRHLGDLPNLVIAADGTGTVEAALPGPAGTVLGQIFDADGAAIVIHASGDDQQTDPSGNSGARIACGVLAQTP